MTKEEEFLEEYKALVEKYGIAIGACGCCGSPWLTKTDDAEIDHLRGSL